MVAVYQCGCRIRHMVGGLGVFLLERFGEACVADNPDDQTEQYHQYYDETDDIEREVGTPFFEFFHWYSSFVISSSMIFCLTP